MSEFAIYHNQRCTKSRQTLQLLRDHGLEPEVIEYLKNPPSQIELRRIVKALGVPAQDLIRRGEKLFAEVGDHRRQYADAAAIKLLCAHPRLIERPIVIRGESAVIGRPPENVLKLINEKI